MNFCVPVRATSRGVLHLYDLNDVGLFHYLIHRVWSMETRVGPVNL